MEALSRGLSAEFGSQGVRSICLRSTGLPETETIEIIFGIHARAIGISSEQFRGMIEGMDAIVAGTLNLDLLLTHTYALDQLGRALDDVSERPDGFVKGVILL